MLNIVRERHRKYHNKLMSKGIGLSKYFIENPTMTQMVNQILPKHKGVFKL